MITGKNTNPRFKDQILDGLTHIIIYHDMEMRIQWANRAALDLIGLPPEQVIGRRCHEVIFDTNHPCKDCAVKRALASNSTEHGEMTTPDGRTWLVTANPIFDEHGNVIGAAGISIDITEVKKLRAEKESLLKALEQASQKAKTLENLIPICAVCKRIRDGKGAWNQVESYIQEHSDLRFSHCICPECAKEHYKDLL